MKLCPGARLGISLEGDVLTFYGDDAGLLTLASFLETLPYWESVDEYLDGIERNPPDLVRKVEVLVRNPRNSKMCCYSWIMDTETSGQRTINVGFNIVTKDSHSDGLDAIFEKDEFGLHLDILAPAELYQRLIWALRQTAFYPGSLFVFQKGPMTVQIEMTPDRPNLPAENWKREIHHISRDPILLENEQSIDSGTIIHTYGEEPNSEGIVIWNPDEKNLETPKRAIFVTLDEPVYKLLAGIMYSFEYPKYSVLYMDLIKKTIGVTQEISSLGLKQGTPGQVLFFVLNDVQKKTILWDRETEGNLYIDFPLDYRLVDRGEVSFSIWQDCPILTMDINAWKYATQKFAEFAYMSRTGKCSPDNRAEWHVSIEWGLREDNAGGKNQEIVWIFYES